MVKLRDEFASNCFLLLLFCWILGKNVGNHYHNSFAALRKRPCRKSRVQFSRIFLDFKDGIEINGRKPIMIVSAFVFVKNICVYFKSAIFSLKKSEKRWNP